MPSEARIAKQLNFYNLLWISVGLHLTLLLCVALIGEGLSWRRRSKIDLDAPIIWADLKVGGGRNQSAAPAPPAAKIPKPETAPEPIKETPKAESVKTETVKTEKPATKTEPAKKATPEPPKLSEEEQRRQAMQAALSGVRQTMTKETEGGGKTSDSAVGNSTLAQMFRQQIKRRIESNLHVTDYDWFGTYRERIVECVVRIDASGEINEVKIKRSSGVPGMDQGVMRAIQQSAPFIAPNEDLQKFYVEEGIQVRFSPKDLEH